MSAVTSAIPTVPTILTLNLTPVVLADVNTYWTMQTVAGSGLSLAAAVTAEQTSISMPSLIGTAPAVVQQPSQPRQPALPAPTITVGSAILIDQEAMSVTAIAGPDPTTNLYTVTVARGATQVNASGATISLPMISAASHSAGASVSVLQYASPADMLRLAVLVPFYLKVTAALGSNSSAYTSTASISFSAS